MARARSLPCLLCLLGGLALGTALPVALEALGAGCLVRPLLVLAAGGLGVLGLGAGMEWMASKGGKRRHVSRS